MFMFDESTKPNIFPQHSLPGTRETQAEESSHPGHGETSEAVAPPASTQPLPHEGRKASASCWFKYDFSSGEVDTYCVKIGGGGSEEWGVYNILCILICTSVWCLGPGTSLQMETEKLLTFSLLSSLGF